MKMDWFLKRKLFIARFLKSWSLLCKAAVDETQTTTVSWMESKKQIGSAGDRQWIRF